MQKKVWEIPETIPEITEEKSEKEISSLAAKGQFLSFEKKKEKNPALATTLSTFLWGSGQIYNNNLRMGLFLLFAMFVAAISFYVLLIDWHAIFDTLRTFGFSPLNIIFIIFTLYTLIGFIWFFNIINAYLQADRTRRNPFSGIEYPFLSAVLSIFIPGWGQFMNGQPKKGILYLFTFFIGLIAMTFILLTPTLWASLSLEYERSIFETLLIGAVILVLLASLLWLINVFDAIIIAADPVKKESIRRRLRYSINRIKSRRSQIEIKQRLKVSFFLTLLLTLSIAISYNLFPKAYYYDTFITLSNHLKKNGMHILPVLIQDTAETFFYKNGVLHSAPRGADREADRNKGDDRQEKSDK